MVQEENSSKYFIVIIAIVAVVAIVGMWMMGSGKSVLSSDVKTESEATDLSGQAVAVYDYNLFTDSQKTSILGML